MEPKQLEKEYTVHVYETGTDGRAALWSLFNYMQDIASEHAILLGFGRDDLMKKNQFWVLSRMFVEIYRLPCWFDKVIMRTWPGGTDKLFAMRYYEMMSADGTRLSAGSSSWLIIDRTTKKIQRPDTMLTRYNDENAALQPPVRSAAKLEGASEGSASSASSKVRVSDLDVNLHSNNSSYVRWLTDSYDLNFILGHSPLSAEINYLAESVHNDDIVIRTSREENGNIAFSHSVFRSSDSRELCRARIEWSEKSSK